MKTFSYLSKESNWKNKLCPVLRLIPIISYEIKGFHLLLLSVTWHSLERHPWRRGFVLKSTHSGAPRGLTGREHNAALPTKAANKIYLLTPHSKHSQQASSL